MRQRQQKKKSMMAKKTKICGVDVDDLVISKWNEKNNDS